MLRSRPSIDFHDGQQGCQERCRGQPRKLRQQSFSGWGMRGRHGSRNCPHVTIIQLLHRRLRSRRVRCHRGRNVREAVQWTEHKRIRGRGSWRGSCRCLRTGPCSDREYTRRAKSIPGWRCQLLLRGVTSMWTGLTSRGDRELALRARFVRCSCGVPQVSEHVRRR